MSTYDVTISLSEDVQKELGKALVLFNLLESALDELLTVFLHLDGRAFDLRLAHIMTAELSFKQKIGQADSILRLIAELAEENKSDPPFVNCPTSFAIILEHWIEIKKHLNLSEEKRNSFVHSQWVTTNEGGQIEVTVLEDGGKGKLVMLFGGGHAETDDSHVAVRSKVTAKQGKGLRYLQEPLSLEPIKGIGVQFSLTLNLIVLFRAYFYQNASDDHHELVAMMISATPVGG